MRPSRGSRPSYGRRARSARSTWAAAPDVTWCCSPGTVSRPTLSTSRRWRSIIVDDGWRDEGLSARVTRADMADIKHPDLHRKVAPGGPLFVTLKSPATWYYGDGQALEPATFIRPPRDRQPTKDVPVHFSTGEEADALFAAFEIVRKQHVEQRK